MFCSGRTDGGVKALGRDKFGVLPAAREPGLQRGKQEQEAAGHMAFLTRRHRKLGQALSPQGDPLPPQGSTAF